MKDKKKKKENHHFKKKKKKKKKEAIMVSSVSNRGKHGSQKKKLVSRGEEMVA